MKPIIIDMKEMSDSSEIYYSKPNKWLVYMIYGILGMVLIALLWACFFKIDIVVKGNGIFRYEEDTYDISSDVTGKVVYCNMQEGKYVENGEVLLTVISDSVEESIEIYEEALGDIDERIEILMLYKKYLDGEEGDLWELKDNRYYEEFLNRKMLLESNISVSDKNVSGQKEQYQKNIDSIQESVKQYEEQEKKLEQAEECVKNRENIFSEADVYYHSMVNSYIKSYESTALQYDNQVKAYEGIDTALQSQKIAEKEQVLASLELQQILSIQQQIETIRSNISSLKSNLSSVQAQMEAISATDTLSNQEISIMTEKNSIAAELLTYGSKKTECENQLKSLYTQEQKYTVAAETSGYLSVNTEVLNGTYIQQGTVVAKILPEEDTFYAEIYVDNADIAKLSDGQQVKMEIPAYPSSEYGYFIGTIDTISKDIKVDQLGSAYYVAKVRCVTTTVTNKKGDAGSIKNGMICQAKVVTDEQSVFKYLLEKINLWE